jgi:signal transduction histidine kinase
MNKKILLTLFLYYFTSNHIFAQTLNTFQSNKSIWAVAWSIIIITLIYFIYKTQQLQKQNQQLKEQNQQRLNQYSKIDKQKKELAHLNEAQEDLMRSVAHDLKAPLNRVFGLVEVIYIDSDNLSNDQKKYLGLIQRVANEARNMIQNWLDVKAIESEQLKIHIENINISNLIQDLLLSYQDSAQKKNIILDTNIEIRNSILMTDSNLLTRILDNLLSNAIKFSPLNEVVTFGVLEKETEIIFSVEDRGVGISKEEKERLFKKFQKLSVRPTAGESSTGLGLSIVKTLVTYLKGEVKVKSIVGEGSIFSVILPKPKTKSKKSVFFDNIELYNS